MEKFVLSGQKLPIYWDKMMIQKLESVFTYYKLKGYKIKENRCLPKIVLNNNQKTFVLYEIIGDGKWKATIEIQFRHSRKEFKNLKFGRMFLRESKNYVDRLKILFPIDTNPGYKGIFYELDDYDNFLDKLMKY